MDPQSKSNHVGVDHMQFSVVKYIETARERNARLGYLWINFN